MSCRAALATCLGQRLVISAWIANSVEFATVTSYPDTVTAILWLSSSTTSDECILVGTSLGQLQLRTINGGYIQAIDLHNTPITSLYARGSKVGIDATDTTEDITIGFLDAAVRIPVWDIWAIVRWHSSGHADRGRWTGGAGSHGAPSPLISKWSLKANKTGHRTFSACLGQPTEQLYAVLAQRSPISRIRLFTAGSNPPIASFEAEVTSTPGIVALVSGLAGAAASSLSKRAKESIVGRAISKGNDDSGRKDLPSSEPALRTAAIIEEKRRVHGVEISECGRWAACCDSLGRVLIVDIEQTILLRMFKGYRRAQVVWLEGGRLIIYAPRKMVIESWDVGMGRRLSTTKVGVSHGVLLRQDKGKEWLFLDISNLVLLQPK